MLSPARSIISKSSETCSFGSRVNDNLLKDYHGPPQLPINVLLLSGGDVSASLPYIFQTDHTITSLTHTNSSALAVARNIIFLDIVGDEQFDPSKIEDLRFIWSLWVDMQWSAKTVERFVKHASKLMRGQLPPNLKVPSPMDMVCLTRIWEGWATAASQLDIGLMEEIAQQRYESIIGHIHSAVSPGSPLPEKYIRPSLADVWAFMHELGPTDLGHLPEYLQKAIGKELRVYFETGNTNATREIKVCANVTMLHPTTKQWAMEPMVSPFETYLNLKSFRVDDDFLSACLRALGSRVESYRPRLQACVVNFSIGDPLEMCCQNSWGDRFDVVDCSGVPDHCGLRNTLIAASSVLSDSARALLVTRSTPWVDGTTRGHASAKDFIEESLGTVIPMIPTLFGLHLVDHVLLGNPEPLVGSRRTSVHLHWRRAEAFSNVRLHLAPTVEAFFEDLQRICFVGAEGAFVDGVTPLTYAYMVRSLLSRAQVSDSDLSRLLQPALSPTFDLAWKTVTARMRGDKLTRMTLTLPLMNKDARQLRLVLASYAQSRVSCIDNIGLSCSPDRKTATVAFLLPEDHQVDVAGTVVYLAQGGACIPVTTPTPLGSALSDVFTGSMPFCPRERSAFDHSCREFDEFYQVELSGLQLEDLTLMTDRKHPSEAGHKVTVKTDDMDQVLGFPHPFNATEIHTSSVPDSADTVQLVLMKAVHEPHPDDWIHRTQWSSAALPEWDSDKIERAVHFHLSAQFDFADLKRQMMNAIEPVNSGLRGVREIIRTMFQSTLLDRNLFYVIRSKHDPEMKNLWFVRVHPPIRVSPLGAPLLLLTTNDHRLAQKLVNRKRLEQSRATDDFKRIFACETAASTGVCPLFVESDDEEAVLRYLFRLNASKLCPDDWPVADMPVGEDSPWLSTFISPSYMDQAGTDDDMEALTALTDKLTTGTPPGDSNRHTEDEPSKESDVCSKCGISKVALKRCSRCKSVKYCSAECQRSDWRIHKSSCN